MVLVVDVGIEFVDEDDNGRGVTELVPVDNGAEFVAGGDVVDKPTGTVGGNEN